MRKAAFLLTTQNIDIIINLNIHLMKKTLKFMVIGIIAVTMVSCQSKEEKAAEIIKKELSKNLYDFDSYQPIETIVTEAKMTMYNDSTCWKKAIAFRYGMKKVSEYLAEAKDAQKHMEIWGKPTSYSSTYSDKQYYQYKEEFDENYKKSKNAYDCKSISKELKELITKLDTTKVIGWEAKHRFRCKTKGGHSTIGEYRYVLDKDFKNVILIEDIEEDSEIRESLEYVANGGFDN